MNEATIKTFCKFHLKINNINNTNKYDQGTICNVEFF